MALRVYTICTAEEGLSKSEIFMRGPKQPRYFVSADRAAIRSQSIRKINSSGWKSRQSSLDRMHRDNVDSIREVNRYNDPVAGGQVELSSHYNYGFRTNDGSYVATDDPNFKGQELQRAQ